MQRTDSRGWRQCHWAISPLIVPAISKDYVCDADIRGALCGRERAAPHQQQRAPGPRRAPPAGHHRGHRGAAPQVADARRLSRALPRAAPGCSAPGRMKVLPGGVRHHAANGLWFWAWRRARPTCRAQPRTPGHCAPSRRRPAAEGGAPARSAWVPCPRKDGGLCWVGHHRRGHGFWVWSCAAPSPRAAGKCSRLHAARDSGPASSHCHALVRSLRGCPTGDTADLLSWDMRGCTLFQVHDGMRMQYDRRNPDRWRTWCPPFNPLPRRGLFYMGLNTN